MANQRDFNDFVDTIIAEAVGEGRQGMAAVAHVVNNRARSRGQTVGQVVRSRSQFDGYSKPGKATQRAQHDAKIRAEAERIARGVISGKIPDPTGGADHFYSGKNKPGWADKLAKTVEIGGHKFYRSAQAVANTVTKPVKDTINAVANAPSSVAAAMRTAGFAPLSRPKVDVPTLPSSQDLPSRAMSPVAYNMGQHRPNPPGNDLVGRVQTAVTDVLGPGYGVNITSGQGEYGSSRHRDPEGIAADLQVVDLRTGRAVTDQQKMMDVAQAFVAQGGKGVGYGGADYMGTGTMHLDTATPGRGQDYEWGSIGNANRGLLADARNSALMPASYYERSLPKSMPAPPSRPSSLTTFAAAPVGKVERAPLGPAAPREAPVGKMTAPSFSSARMMAAAPVAPTQTFSKAGSMDKVPRGNLQPPAPNAGMSLAAQYASYGAGKLAPPTVDPLTTSNVSPITQTKLLPPQTQVPTFVPNPKTLPNVPVQMPPPMPVVTAPKLPRLMTPTQRVDQAFAVAGPPPAPTMPSAMDVYSGQANRGMASDGSMVSRDEYGRTAVSNRFGATTITNPDGHQMAARGGGIAGPIGNPGISAPNRDMPSVPQRPSQLGNMVRGGVGSVVGGGLGGLLAGPIGAALGAVVASDLARGRNPIDRLGIGTFTTPVTDQFGFTQPMTFANPKSGGAFPDAPRNPSGGLGGKDSNRSERSMRDISPAAARDIKSGKAGLF